MIEMSELPNVEMGELTCHLKEAKLSENQHCVGELFFS